MKKILFATDGSQYAEEAAWLLAHLSQNETYELIVVTAIEGAYHYQDYEGRAWLAALIEHDRAAATANYQQIEEMFDGANARVRHVIKEGHSADSILRVAKDEGVDLIVVGAKGRSAVSRMLLGSTSDFVATHATCSVLVVRPTGLRESGQAPKIAMFYEDAGPAQAALEEIAEVKWGADTDLRVVTVCSHLAEAIDASFRSSSVKSAQRAAKQIRAVVPNTKVDIVDREHIGDGLVRYAKDEACDLVVVGETPHTRWGRVILGSVSRFVLRHAPCSVWITRNRMISGHQNEQDRKQMAST